MNTFLRNTILKLCNAVAVHVAATRDALAERLQSIRDTLSLMYNRMMENMRYGQQERLENIVKKEAEEEEKKPAANREEEQEPKEQQQDDERYDTVTKIKLVYERKCLKGFRVKFKEA